VFGNKATTSGAGVYTAGIVINNYRSCQSYTYWGQCSGSSSWDGNQSGKQGYGCLDEVGHFFSTNSGGSNTLSPLYAWNNTINGNLVGVTKDSLVNSCATFQNMHMLENREFYNYSSNFDGSSGVGTGPLASRPAACSPITGYFATDTSTLYKCISPNTWTSYYTPYTYPHPLQSGAEAPAPPSGLAASVL
jgi:hypothetical protein